MPSRADLRAEGVTPRAATTQHVVRIVDSVLHVVGVVCMLLVAWRLFVPRVSVSPLVEVGASGVMDASVATLLRAQSDSLGVTLRAPPDARTRALLRAMRGSGRTVALTAPLALSPLAVTVEEEWRASGGTRVQAVASGAAPVAVSDAAGLVDTIPVDTAGLRVRSGPVQGALHVDLPMAHAAAAVLGAGVPDTARVLVAGAVSWESRFLIAALEEAGWPVDASIVLSPKVTISQGTVRLPSRSRHAIVVVLPGAPASVMALLPQFVRAGGGVVIVGEAARNTALSAIRAGTPGVTIAGEIGAEASAEPRHGLDLVPIMTLAAGSVALEARDGRTAIAARRVGAGRVVQVGYDDSWLWRMAGDDDAPIAHRRWWTSLLSGIVPLAAPVRRGPSDAEHDTLDAAPVAALARELGLPQVRAEPLTSATSQTFAASVLRHLDVRWLLAVIVLSLVASWTLRRWRGLA